MHAFQQEIAAFAERKAAELSEARRRVALRLSCGMDLPDPAQADCSRTLGFDTSDTWFCSTRAER